MTKWSQKKPCIPRRIAQKALSGVLNGHISKNAVRRLARKAGLCADHVLIEVWLAQRCATEIINPLVMFVCATR